MNRGEYSSASQGQSALPHMSTWTTESSKTKMLKDYVNRQENVKKTTIDPLLKLLKSHKRKRGWGPQEGMWWYRYVSVIRRNKPNSVNTTWTSSMLMGSWPRLLPCCSLPRTSIELLDHVLVTAFFFKMLKMSNYVKIHSRFFCIQTFSDQWRSHCWQCESAGYLLASERGGLWEAYELWQSRHQF